MSTPSVSVSHTHSLSHTHLEAYREQVVVSVVAAALFLRLLTAGLSTLSLGSSVRMRCGVLVLKSDWPFTWPGFLSCRSRSSSTPAEKRSTASTVVLEDWNEVLREESLLT